MAKQSTATKCRLCGTEKIVLNSRWDKYKCPNPECPGKLNNSRRIPRKEREIFLSRNLTQWGRRLESESITGKRLWLYWCYVCTYKVRSEQDYCEHNLIKHLQTHGLQ